MCADMPGSQPPQPATMKARAETPHPAAEAGPATWHPIDDNGWAELRVNGRRITTLSSYPAAQEAAERINAALASHPLAATPVASHDGVAVRDKKRIDDVVAECGGWWQPCSGCHETSEGYSAGFPYDQRFQCERGSGCHECGGLGVVWATGPTEEECRAMLAAPPAPDAEVEALAKSLIDIAPYIGKQLWCDWLLEAGAALRRMAGERDALKAKAKLYDDMRELATASGFTNVTDAIMSAGLDREERTADLLARVARERDEALQENYDLKYAAAGGEDAPGAAHAVTVADVTRWQKEDERRLRDAEQRAEAAEKVLREIIEATKSVQANWDPAKTANRLARAHLAKHAGGGNGQG